MKSLEQINEKALKANFTERQQEYFDKLMSELEVISDGLGFVELEEKVRAKELDVQILRDYIAKKEQIVDFIENKVILDLRRRDLKPEDKVCYVRRGNHNKYDVHIEEAYTGKVGRVDEDGKVEVLLDDSSSGDDSPLPFSRAEAEAHLFRVEASVPMRDFNGVHYLLDMRSFCGIVAGETYDVMPDDKGIQPDWDEARIMKFFVETKENGSNLANTRLRVELINSKKERKQMWVSDFANKYRIPREYRDA